MNNHDRLLLRRLQEEGIEARRYCKNAAVAVTQKLYGPVEISASSDYRIKIAQTYTNFYVTKDLFIFLLNSLIGAANRDYTNAVDESAPPGKRTTLQLEEYEFSTPSFPLYVTVQLYAKVPEEHWPLVSIRKKAYMHGMPFTSLSRNVQDQYVIDCSSTFTSPSEITIDRDRLLDVIDAMIAVLNIADASHLRDR